MQRVIGAVGLSLFVLHMTGCSPVPIPYLRRVPEGISRISVCDVESGRRISDPNICISYHRLMTECIMPWPEVFTNEPNDSYGIWTERPENERRINVKRNKRNDFDVIGRIELVSFQPLWMPALPHTFFSDYAVYVEATAEGYWPLTLRYYCVNPLKGELQTNEEAVAILKRGGVLEIKLRKKTPPLQ